MKTVTHRESGTETLTLEFYEECLNHMTRKEGTVVFNDSLVMARDKFRESILKSHPKEEIVHDL